MDRWSYRIEPYTRRLVIHVVESAQEMDELGTEGWEAYAVIPYDVGFIVFFKRREDDASEES